MVFSEKESKDLFFAHLVGGYQELAIAEIKSLFEMMNSEFSIKGIMDQILLLESCRNAIFKIARRACLCHGIYENIAVIDVSAEILNNFSELFPEIIKTLDWKEVIKQAKTFSVNVIRIKRYLESIKNMDIVNAIGNFIKNSLKIKVSIEKPDVKIVAFLTENKIILGKFLTSCARKDVLTREPSHRPVIHPATMNAIHSRILINLAQVREGDIVLDPFCGVGGIMIEGCIVGAYMLGMDLNPKVLRGAQKNLLYFGCNNYTLIRGNAKHFPIPLESIDAIVTDPPYGRTSSTYKYKLEDLLEAFLDNSADVLKKGKIIAFAIPSTVTMMKKLSLPKNFELIFSSEVCMHKTLTRRFIALRKK